MIESGIYRILNIKNKKCYVGSSNCLSKREKQHFKMLEKGEHHSLKLQRSWNKTKNKKVFNFEVLEKVENLDKLKEREQYWLDYYDAYEQGYNCSKLVDNPKYARKNLKKLERKKEVDKLFKIFKDKFESYKNRIIAGKILIGKCYEKHYSPKIYKLIILAIDYFIPKLIENTKMKINFSNRKIYVWVISREKSILEYKLDKNEWKFINEYKINKSYYQKWLDTTTKVTDEEDK